MFPSGHDKPHFYMQSHSDPSETVCLSLGIRGQGTSVHVPSAAHTRAVLEGSHTSSLLYTPHIYRTSRISQALCITPTIKRLSVPPKAAASIPQYGDASRSLLSVPQAAMLWRGMSKLHCQHSLPPASIPCVIKSVGAMFCFQSK